MNAKKLATNALIAAIYAATTIFLAPISYGALQFRVSEALTLLPFLRKDTVWGLTVGCFLANILNPMGANPLDVIFGTLATFLAAVVTAKCKKLWLAPFPPVVFNAVIIGAVISFSATPDNFLPSAVLFGSQVGIGELVACFAFGIPLVMAMKKLKLLEE